MEAEGAPSLQPGPVHGPLQADQCPEGEPSVVCVHRTAWTPGLLTWLRKERE